ncbi:MAG: hypothetical protein KF838_01040 [Phycisphaeraceae bacterium]|nr:MAG: hypothetical protein KF838_01040 [Phycisphaeraceae bacterium]
MHAGSSIPRSLLLALWLGIAAVVLQGFGAALHACSHPHHDQAPITSPVARTQTHNEVHTQTYPAHTCSHTHHAHTSPHEAPVPERDGGMPPEDDHDSNSTPIRHNDCPTCLKLASNAREILSSPLYIADAPRLLTLCVKHTASEARSHIADPNLPARGPPTLIA